MASVSTINPTFAEFDDQDTSKTSSQRLSQEPTNMFNPVVSSPSTSRNHSVATYAAVAVVGAAALAVGVVLGESMSSASAATVTTISAGETSAAVSDPVMVLSSMYADQPSLAQIKLADLDALVTMYDNTHSPNQWANNFVPEQFVSEWLKVRQEEEIGDSSRRLRAQRELIGSYPVDLTQVSHDSTFADRVNPITYENDAAGVEMKGSRCIISFDTSQDFADWSDNLNLGNGDIYSIQTYTEAGVACPTSTCTEKRILGQGYDGFRLAWNNLNTAVWASIESTCGGASEYVFTGYSRGGAIAAMASASIYVEGLLPAAQIKLITFGAPLAVSTAMSNTVHNQYDQYRFVYQGDPVPSVPFKSWGVRHFGEMRCYECSYDEGRDKPTNFNPFNVGDHSGYEDWSP